MKLYFNALTYKSIFMGVFLFSSISYGQTTIGRWCDQLVPNMPQYNRVMSIVITDDSRIELQSDFNDDSSSIKELRELSADIFEPIEARFGERYRISSSDGNLQLIDEDGLIRTARRLENSAQPGECGS